MTSWTTFNYRDRTVIDIKTLFEALIFLMANALLGIIFLFLAIEEIEWSVFSSRQMIRSSVIDKTSWNLKTLFKVC